MTSRLIYYIYYKKGPLFVYHLIDFGRWVVFFFLGGGKGGAAGESTYLILYVSAGVHYGSIEHSLITYIKQPPLVWAEQILYYMIHIIYSLR